LAAGFVDVTLRGTITLSGGGSMTAGPGAAAAPVNTPNTLTVIAGGALAGSGTINGKLHNVGGEVFGIDNLNVNGAYEQEAAGIYSVNVVANGVNSSMDVTGTATLAGDLFIAPDAGYMPAGLDSFVIMTYASVADCFMSVTNRELPGAGPGGLDLVFAHVQNATDYRLVVTLPGDYTLDGSVTGADYTVWADSFGDPHTAFNTGDGNADGMTTGADFTIWADHFGETLNPPGPVASETAPSQEDWDRLREMGLARVPAHEALGVKEALSPDTLLSAGGFPGHAVPEPSAMVLGALAALGLLAAAKRRS
jgi:hypothetical protein